jgi:predicted cupin superfamily sugar epimerase
MSMAQTISFWINRLGLAPHPEGGYFREVYRSPELIPKESLPARFGGPRSFATSIYFLLPGDQVSALHRIQSDETWHFYTGAPLRVAVIEEGGAASEIHLGPSPEEGQSFQAVVPAGAWFGAYLDNPSAFALVGCTVAPGFDFNDFELGSRAELSAMYPQHRGIIERLTRPS